MIEGRTILCFASGYDAPPTSKHHVMHLLAERNTVLWVNYHASRTPTASSADLLHVARRLRGVLGGLERVRPNLYVLTPLVVPVPGTGWARRINRMLILGQLRAALSLLRAGPLQIWSFTPDVSYLLAGFQAEKTVYYCVDDFAHFSGYDSRQVLRDEAALAGAADLVVTTSTALLEAKRRLNANTILVPHGVDYGHFAAALTATLPEPQDVAGIPHPRLGFFGLIRDWIDLDLLAEVARRRRQWHFVLIGDSAVDLSAYRRLANMHFLGRRAYSRLPAYCGALDAALIPFRINELTLAVNPIKLREYMAAGLPVVATPLPEVQVYKDLVHVADGAEAFAAGIERALATGTKRRRELSAAMAGETWPAKLDVICRSLMQGAAVCDCSEDFGY